MDDGTRGYAVRELGEAAVRALEVEVVKANADRLSPTTFVAMGIPTASVLEGLGWEPGSTEATRRENDGLSVRARGRLDQAVAWSKGRINYRPPVTKDSGEVSVRIEASLTAHQTSTQALPAAVTLTRRPAGDVALQLDNHERPVPGTDVQAADVLGIELEAWARSRTSIELGLAAVAAQRPALRPPGLRTARDEERSDLTTGLRANGPGVGSSESGPAR